MTYKITRVIHPVFNGQKLEAEVELKVNRDSVYVGDNPIPDVQTRVEGYKVLWITNEQGDMIWHIGNGKPAQGFISPELGLAIDTEVRRIEDLEEDRPYSAREDNCDE